MFYVTDYNGFPVWTGLVHLTHKAAETAAARRLSDPLPRAPALPHFARKTWQDKGYMIFSGLNMTGNVER